MAPRLKTTYRARETGIQDKCPVWSASPDACIRGYDKTRAFKRCENDPLASPEPTDPTSVILDMQPTILVARPQAPRATPPPRRPVELPRSGAPLAADAYRFIGLRIAAQPPS